MEPKAAERKVVGYCRVSTEEQASEGVSLDAQEARIRAYAVATGRELTEMMVDAGQSAKSLQRPGMALLVDGVRTGEIGAVVLLKLDRLTRSVRDLGELLDLFDKAGADLISVSESLDTSSAAGRLMLNLLASVSQWEREAIAERTSTALAYKRKTLQAYGPTPFGFRREGQRLVLHEAEQHALTTMREMHSSGASLRQIASYLEANHISPPRGQRWHASSVRAVLTSKIAQEPRRARKVYHRWARENVPGVGGQLKLYHLS